MIAARDLTVRSVQIVVRRATLGTAQRGGDLNMRLHSRVQVCITRVQVCVLEPLWSRMTQMEKARRLTTALARAIDTSPWDDVTRALPDKGWVLRPAPAPPNVKTTSVSAGQHLCRAPRRNRTGDPILTIRVAAHL